MVGSYARLPVEFVRGEGSWLWDADGNEYLDFLSGISVLNVGHCHPAVVAAVREQAGTLTHTTNLFYTAPAMRLARRLSESSLAGLYALSSAFVLPSLVEGFGLPVLEAMLRDVPVACSNSSSLPEVAGDAALLFDPRDESAIAGAITRLLRDGELADGLRERGCERVREFTWERTARATIDSYRRALALPPRLRRSGGAA